MGRDHGTSPALDSHLCHRVRVMRLAAPELMRAGTAFWIGRSRGDGSVVRVFLRRSSVGVGPVSRRVVVAQSGLRVDLVLLPEVRRWGVELVLAILVAGVCAALVAHVIPQKAARRRSLLSAAIALLIVSPFFALSGGTGLLLSATDDGTAAVGGRYTRDGHGCRRLGGGPRRRPRRPTASRLIPFGSGGAAQLFYPDGWYQALNASLSKDSALRINVLRARADTPGAAAPLVRILLSTDSALEVVVDPAYAEALRTALGTPGARCSDRELVAVSAISRGRGRTRTPGRAGSRPGTRCASRWPSRLAPC